MSDAVRSSAFEGPERIPTVVSDEYDDIARRIAGRMAELVRDRNGAGRSTVLGLATGSTPIGVYERLIRARRDGQENALHDNGSSCHWSTGSEAATWRSMIS